MTLDVGLLDRLDGAMRFAFEETARRTPGGRVARQDGLVLAIGIDPSPLIVNTIVPEAKEVEPDAFGRAVAVFRAVGHLPSIVTRDHRDGAVEEHFGSRGYTRLIGLPGMILESRLPDEPAPVGVSLHRVLTEADLERWLEGNLYGFAEDDGDRAAIRSAVSSLGALTGGPVTGWYAMADGRGVAASMAMVDPVTRVGLLGWVGTDIAYRRRGIGRAISLAATNAAFDLGATMVTLQASPKGLPVYQRMGYETVTGYKVWLPPDGPAA